MSTTSKVGYAALVTCIVASAQGQAQKTPWCETFRREAGGALHSTVRPLTKSRIEKALRNADLPTAWHVVTPIVGMPGTYVIGTGDDYACAFWVTPNGVVTTIASGLETLIDHAEYRRGQLLLGGHQYWYGNAPCYQLAIFSKHGDRWTLNAQASTEYEIVDSTLPTNAIAGKTFVLRSRTYPKYMNASHATALTLVEETFRIRGSSVKRIGQRRGNSAYNTLDQLAGYFKRQDARGISRLVPSSEHREALLRAWKEVGPTPSVSTPGSKNTVNGTYYQWGDWSEPTVKIRFSKVAGRWRVRSVEMPKKR